MPWEIFYGAYPVSFKSHEQFHSPNRTLTKDTSRRSQNVEESNNGETTLVDTDIISSWTPPWEHDNPFIRVPMRLVRPLWPHRWVTLLILFLCLTLEYFIRGKFSDGLMILWCCIVYVVKVVERILKRVSFNNAKRLTFRR